MSACSEKPVCLVIPPSVFLLDERVFMNLGILKVAAVLEKSGYPVEVLDLSGVRNYDYVLALHARQSAATAFGITATTPQYPAVTRIGQVLREVRPDARLIVGGPHPTLVMAALRRERKMGIAGRAARHYNHLVEAFDVIVAGDGETTIGEALITSEKVIDVDDPKSEKFMTNQMLDASPFPARHLVDVSSYHYEIEGERALSLIAQLGCPFACGFCAGRTSPMLRNIRLRSTANVLAEVEQLYRVYGVKGFMCYDSATEVLTERGFIPFSKLSSVDKIATLNSKNGELVYELPKRVIRRHFQGKLITVCNRLVDLAVTPEHRMWLKMELEENYRHVEAQEMVNSLNPITMLQRLKWRGESMPTFSIPAYKVRYLGRNRGSPKVLDGMRVFPAKTWVRFMAWYLAEGSCYRPKVRNGHGYRICIKQQASVNRAKVAEIKAVLTDLGYCFSYSSNQFHIDSKELYEYLKQFGTAYHKHVPAEFKRMSSSLIKLFIKTYCKGDGSISKQGQEVIVSYSKQMRDDLQEMAFKCGYWAFVNDKYKRVQLSQQRDLTINSKWGKGNQFGKQAYDGSVYCVTVSSGVILVRRNGKAVWSGNCYDDELNVNPKMIELMDGLAKLQQRLGVAFKLRGCIKAQLFTDAQAEALKRAGFRVIFVGFESGDPRILENINKKATQDDNTRCVDIAHRHGIKVKASMSIGHPGERAATVEETRRWLLKVGPDDFNVTIITSTPGTFYYDYAEPNGPNGAWTYTAPKTGDRLYSYDLDYRVVADYYNGRPTEYRSFVYTDYLTAEDLVSLRDDVEFDVRQKLRIPFSPTSPTMFYDNAMGQVGLPPNILRASSRQVQSEAWAQVAAQPQVS